MQNNQPLYNPSNNYGIAPYGQVSYPQIQPTAQQYPAPYGQPMNRPFVPMTQNQLGGRMIEKENEVTPNEVPMDGSIYLFPMADYSCIYAKQWRNDGSGVDTITYVPLVSDVEQVNSQENANAVQEILTRLDGIEQALQQQNRPRNNQSRKNQNGSYHKRNEEE